MKKLGRLLFPSGVLALTITGLLFTDTARPTLYRFSSTIFIVVLALGLFFTLRFGRSRYFFVILMLAGMFSEVFNHPYMMRFFTSMPIAGHSGVPLAPMAAAALSLLFLLVMYLRALTPARDGFFWATAIVVAGFFTQNGPTFFQLSTSGAIVVLLISMIEAGHFFAYRDELTGLPSRRALNEKLAALGRTYSIAMVDVDHFKRVNDRYGHDVGDEVRKKGKNTTATKIKSGKRENVSVTVSIGLAQRSPGHASPEAVIKAADRALYRAKKNGRNRTETSV